MARIYVVEDNASIREAVEGYLRLDDHEVLPFEGVTGVLDAMRHRPPDLVILDVMLPDGSGFDLARKIRALSAVPLVFLTARVAESDRITGFELGADDYVVKPFSPRELALRVRAHLRRSPSRAAPEDGPRRWTLGDVALELDPAAHRAALDGRPVELTAAEWKILWHLATAAPAMVDRERLLGEALGYAREGSERTVDTHVKNLRAKLGELAWIDTVRGYGYRFSGNPDA